VQTKENHNGCCSNDLDPCWGHPQPWSEGGSYENTERTFPIYMVGPAYDLNLKKKRDWGNGTGNYKRGRKREANVLEKYSFAL